MPLPESTDSDGLIQLDPANRQARASNLIRLIEEDRDWLTELIKVRDTVTHFDGLESSGMSAELVGDNVVVGQPMDKAGRPIAEILDWLYFNLLTAGAGTLTFTGGTGRYRDASGSADFTAVFSRIGGTAAPVQGMAFYSVQGTVSLQHGAR